MSAPDLPTELKISRGDPVYNAHGYLTKVPYSAITPFIEKLSRPGETVLDLYAGSGMTGVAALVSGRKAELRDISILGRHIAENYTRLVDADELKAAGAEVVDKARAAVGNLYATRCGRCEEVAVLSKTVWSAIYECAQCGEPVNYYEVFKKSDWTKAEMCCSSCGSRFGSRDSLRVGAEPVLDYIRCGCEKTQIEQEHTKPINKASLKDAVYPDLEIGNTREMFQSSALAKHGLVTTGAFYSDRNLAVLAALHGAIDAVEDEAIRGKLRFAFTAILTRASKRYQWHPKGPLNAANQNYYVAPVFYEWNVYELFERKVRAAARSDARIREEMSKRKVPKAEPINYLNESADKLDLADGSVGYVFTDPPFGSQIFYSDMNLFQEAWLDDVTDDRKEAVIARSKLAGDTRSAERYEKLITESLCEAHRVLKRGGWLSLVFSNSNGEMWLLLQRAIHAAGFSLEHVTLLDKGQRSVKGLASGFESVVTSDLILTLKRMPASRGPAEPIDAPTGALEAALESALKQDDLTPTRVYLWIITDYLRRNMKVAQVSVRAIRDLLAERDYVVDSVSGRLEKKPQKKRKQKKAVVPQPAKSGELATAV